MRALLAKLLRPTSPALALAQAKQRLERQLRREGYSRSQAKAEVARRSRR